MFNKKIVGMMVVGPGEADKWLEPCLAQWKDLVDDAIIVGNNTTPAEEEIIRKTGYWFYRDDREWGTDMNQPKIKEDLLQKVFKLKPDWILPLDADEFYDSTFTRDSVQELDNRGHISYFFCLTNLWGDEEHYNHKRTFWNIRAFKSMPELPSRYERKDVHCGLAPPVFYNNRFAGYAPHLVVHYGLLTGELRKKKVARYEKYDPNHKWMADEYYDDIADTTEPWVRPYVESEWLKKVQAEAEQENKNKKVNLP